VVVQFAVMRAVMVEKPAQHALLTAAVAAAIYLVAMAAVMEMKHVQHALLTAEAVVVEAVAEVEVAE
jgi:hypothetical protein